MKNKGKMFVIEGTDGSGKATQTELLAKRWENEGVNYRTVTFPNYESPSSSLVKMYLNGEFGEKPEAVNAYVASSFFAVDRWATWEKEYREYYEQGGIVLADRYTPSNLIHQAGKIDDEKERENFLNWVYEYEYKLLQLPEPDMVIFLNMPTEYAQQVMKERENKITHEQKKDIHESDVEYLDKAYINACELAKRYNWKIVNCVEEGKVRTREEIHNEIYQLVNSCK